MKQKFEDRIISSVFYVSKKPVLFKDLLKANSYYNEGLLVDPSLLNFRFLYGKSYVIFIALCFCVLIPFLILTHGIFEKIDFHFSILSAIFVTSSIFIGFDIFKAWARKKLTHRLIKEAWEIHFPYFPYEKYSTKVEIIYSEAIKQDIPKRELEKYVLDKIVNS